MIKEVNKKEKRITVSVPKDAFNVIVKNPSKQTSEYFSLDYEMPSKNKGVKHLCGFAFMFKDFGGRRNYPSKMKIAESNNGTVIIQYN